MTNWCIYSLPHVICIVCIQASVDEGRRLCTSKADGRQHGK
jgi:predicted nucleic acid-binding Zn ribbon protein